MKARALIGLLAAVMAMALMTTGCGGHASAAVPVAKVPLDIVPPTLPGPAGDPPMTLAEYKEGAERLNTAGGRSVIADGRVFEIRRGSTLVGALQISTLVPRVDVTSAKQRDHLASLMVSGSVQKVNVSGVEVVVAKTTDKLVLVWFGDHLFEVLQIKGVGIDPLAILKGIIDFQQPSGRLHIGAGRSN
jgi:hypothetical protein